MPVRELRRVICGLHHRVTDGKYTEGFNSQTNPHLLIVIAYMGSIVIRTIGLLITDDYSNP